MPAAAACARVSVRLAGKLEVERVTVAARAHEHAGLEGPTDGRPSKAAAATPVRISVIVDLGPPQDQTARRTQGRIGGPALTHRYPRDVRNHARSPDHVRIVGVRDRRKPFHSSESGAPPPAHHRDLADPVELVAGQVPENKQRRLGAREEPRKVRLIGLDHRKCIRGDADGRACQRGDDACRHVRAGRIRDNGTSRPQPGNKQPRRRCLSIRRRDEHDAATGDKAREGARECCEDHPAPDDEAISAPEGLR